MKIIGLEEHVVVSEVLEEWQALDPRRQDLATKSSAEGEAGHRLLEFGPDRLAAMDDSRIDVRVLSLTTPGVQNPCSGRLGGTGTDIKRPRRGGSAFPA